MKKINSFTQAISISIPKSSLHTNLLSSLKELLTQTYHFSLDAIDSPNFSSRKLNRSLRQFSPKFKYAGLLVAVLAIGSLVFYLGSKLYTPNQSVLGSQDRPTVTQALSTMDINREFTFPLLNESSEEVSRFKYEIQKAELRSDIIVKGQRATAVQGRAFLIVTLKISNDYKQAISINTRDYMRLIVNGNEAEKLAPEIHNDPVEVQAISIKPTRLGFTIDENTDSLLLRVGEINGDKTDINLEL